MILDFGSQYTQLIARAVRELNVYCEIFPHDVPWRSIYGFSPQAIILSGGPSSASSLDRPECAGEIFASDIPVLGICYGLQYMTAFCGGRVRRARKREYGRAQLVQRRKNALLARMPRRFTVWMSHGDEISRPAPGFVTAASTDTCRHAVLINERKRLYGVQFHPEVIHTFRGRNIIKAFLFQIAGCRGDWTIRSFMKDEIARIRRTVGSHGAVCALSGGVDSSVAAAITIRAIGKRLTCIFVDNGLLRHREAQEIRDIFRGKFGLKVMMIDAKKQFLEKLKGIADPERKRRIIGHEFISVFEKAASNLRDVRFLVQGTLYPDRIESRSVRGPSATIKTHHNVGGLPETMKLALIEPLKFLFKDETRKLGREMGLPDSIVERQPFPGPGLAVRLLGDVTEERLEILRKSDAIVREETESAGYGAGSGIWQYFAVLLPVRTVGVMGDERTYEHAIVIRAVTSRDGMTADWVRFPHAFLGRLSSRIINEVSGVNRVVYDISSKPPATIEWE